jgi:hypothetical protein
MSHLSEGALRTRIRAWTIFLIAGLMLSGLTAIPLKPELHLLTGLFAGNPGSPLEIWLLKVQSAVDEVSSRWSFLGLGTDWLAFGHVVIGLGFIGLLINPVRNEWLITWGLIACGLVIPWAWFFGALRGIPWGWRVIDSSFGVGGALPLLLIRRCVNELRGRGNVG